MASSDTSDPVVARLARLEAHAEELERNLSQVEASRRDDEVRLNRGVELTQHMLRRLDLLLAMEIGLRDRDMVRGENISWLLTPILNRDMAAMNRDEASGSRDSVAGNRDSIASNRDSVTGSRSRDSVAGGGRPSPLPSSGSDQLCIDITTHIALPTSGLASSRTLRLSYGCKSL